ncbi:hypothetical protein RJ639_014716 [Escallonia herrerae]|uniref:Uncharacterized protein n=1 Tax=Escallonia herrerae TaxID=1293975 RepID=A0AA89AN01_9ASTE|nr:hypothetical protein RJ639_014716 [Escallonia herrerae]
MLRMLNKESDTPLHEAVRNCHFDVDKFLVEEDPDFSCPANNAEETPLYLALEKGYDELVSLIFETCTAPAYSGPYGRTALHRAAISNSKGSFFNIAWKVPIHDRGKDKPRRINYIDGLVIYPDLGIRPYGWWKTTLSRHLISRKVCREFTLCSSIDFLLQTRSF